MKRAFPILCLVLLASCATTPTPKELALARASMEEAIPKEPKGNYFVGRRYYKVDYKMWGYVRRPREPWVNSQLVMFNEDKVLAPDRAQNSIGSDNGFEYRLYGRFSGERIYEPASNGIYPEFVFERAELISQTPGPIFKNRKALKPEARYFPGPY